MSIISPIQSKFISALASEGRQALNTQFPDEFEYYLIAFELVDSQGSLDTSIVFPVLPKSISIREPNVTNIKRTAGGVLSLSTPTFIPVDITLSGNFGRKFRFMNGQDIVSLTATARGRSNETTTGQKSIFDKSFKTGYGVTKMLQALHKKSVQLDSNNQPYRLYFYNLAFNANYVVESMSMSFDQNESENMIWSYSIQLKGIAPLSQIQSPEKSKANISRLVNVSQSQKIVDSIIGITKSTTKNLQNQLLANTTPLAGQGSSIGIDIINNLNLSKLIK